jgi:hypothetical protein
MENQTSRIRRFRLPSKQEIVSAFLSFTKLEWRVFQGVQYNFYNQLQEI